jgi:hypothetical protein
VLSTLEVWAQDSFPFEKSAGDDGSGFVIHEIDGDPLEQLFEGTEFSKGSTSTLPEEFALLNVYPNPFNPITVLSYELRVASEVNLSVYDLQGREVAKLVNGFRDAGTHEVTFDGTGVASGVYLYRLEAGEFSAKGKMVLMK